MSWLIDAFFVFVVIFGVYLAVMISIGYAIQTCRRLFAASARLLKRQHSA